MSLFAVGLMVIIVFGLIVYGITFYLRGIVGFALTDKFQAAEAVSNGEIPEKWVAQINRRLHPQRLIPIFQRHDSGIELAVAKIDKLYRYFEKTPFVEDETAREILLEQLLKTKRQWAKMSWEILIRGAKGG
jgi:hypothetical protein